MMACIFGWPFVKRFAICYRTVVSVLSVCLWRRCTVAKRLDETWHGMEVGFGPGHIVLGGDPTPPQKGHSPQFSAHVCCRQTAGWIKMPLGTDIGLGPGDIVLDGHPAPLPKKGTQPPTIFGPFLSWPNDWLHQDATWCGGRPQPRPHCARWGPCSSPPLNGHSPQFLAHVYCGQTAGLIKTPLCTEVDLGPGHIVLDGDPDFTLALFASTGLRRMSVSGATWRESRWIIKYVVDSKPVSVFGPLCENET